MSQKIFVSYKYADSNVRQMAFTEGVTTVRSYVDEFIVRAEAQDFMIYKGEMDGEDLSEFTDDTIWSKLKDKIYDSSLTLVFISPNMKEWGIADKEQWIPNEVSYSLKEHARNGYTSRSNALMCVILPDKFGSYSYKNNMLQFDIIRQNEISGYAEVVQWDNFILNMPRYIESANNRSKRIKPYKMI